MSSSARAIGHRVLTADDPEGIAAIPVHLLYSSTATPRAVAFGPYEVTLAPDGPAAPAGALRPALIAISHGQGSTPWALRGLAAALVDAGHVVALIEHPGDRRGDTARSGTPAILADRPRQLGRALDVALDDAVLGGRLASDGGPWVVVVGHSIGGYTALAAAGGRPLALPNQTADGRAHPVAATTDPRIGALVLLAPALPWLVAPGALAEVRAPILVRTGERDPMAPPAFVAEVLRGLPPEVAVDAAVVPGAGHFGFLSPFPPALAVPGFGPAEDPPGFDRVAYQARLAAEVVAFVAAR
jgi:predicted dienelactone hydrolase